MSGRPPAIEIVNLRASGFWAFGRWTLWLGWLLLQLAAVGGLAGYILFSQDLPPLEQLVHYQPPQTTRVYSADGFLLAELATTHRTVLPPDRIPLRLRQAFLAAEDRSFYQHGGIDVLGVARAVYRMIEGGGRPRQGGSTITQQLAKALIGREKTFARKAREAVLARRLEAVLTKDQILWTYLNEVYLGRNAYGVAEAAQAYFGRGLGELQLGELAYLAGLPQRPSALSRDPAAALQRQRYVLDQLVENGWATAAERDEAIRRGVVLAPEQDISRWRAPYIAEAVRRQLVEQLGERTVYEGGLRVETTASLADQHHAEAALVEGLTELDRRQGFRRALGNVTPQAGEQLRQAWARASFEPGVDGLRPALVREVRRDTLHLLVGTEETTLTRSRNAWAAPYDETATENKAQLGDFREILRTGDLVVVRPAPPRPEPERQPGKRPPRPSAREERVATPDLPPPDRYELVPFGPAGVQGAVLLQEVGTGYTRALVGGREPDVSAFDRTQQACRQPGSVFKPIYYSAALARGFTPATILTDAPFKVEEEGKFFAYRARNADRQFRGDMLLADALAQSRNIPSLKVFLYVGAVNVVYWAQALGVTSTLEALDSLALGSSCVRPAEMVRVYSRFAEWGRQRPELLVRRILDGAGQPLLDQRHPGDDRLSAAAALRRTLEYRPADPVPGFASEVAYQTAALLRGVVERGTAARAKTLPLPVAGKTGTTDRYDAWFVGFSPYRVAGVWVGPDENKRVLGRGEHGGKVALPIFVRVMEQTQQGLPPAELPGPAPPGIEWVEVDPRSGERSRGAWALRLPFLTGTAPTDSASSITDSAGDQDPDRLGGRF